MGQVELFDLLKDLRRQGEDFYSPDQLRKLLKDKGFSNGVLHGLAQDLAALDRTNYLEVNFNWNGKLLDWTKEVRLKKKYL